MANSMLVGNRASDKMAAFLAQHPLPARRDVPLTELGYAVVQQEGCPTRRRVRAKGWRGFFGQEDEIEERDVHFAIMVGGRPYDRYEKAPETIPAVWQYAIRDGRELWAVVSGYIPGFAEALNVKLADLPEPALSGDAILPEGWVSQYWSTCGCGQEGGHDSKILFESEVKKHLRSWLADHGG